MLFPFSPHWLAAKGRYDEALQVIADIHGGGGTTHPVVEAEFHDVCQAAEEAKIEDSICYSIPKCSEEPWWVVSHRYSNN